MLVSPCTRKEQAGRGAYQFRFFISLLDKMFVLDTSRDSSLLVVCTSLLLFFSLTGCGIFGGGGGGDDPPGPPDNLQLSSSQSGVEVVWQASSDASGYNVYRSEESIPEGDLSSATRVNGESLVDGTSFLDDGAENTTAYFYRVTAENDAGESDPTPESEVQMPFPETPGPPE